MEKILNQQQAIEYLNQLINQPLAYGIKSPDMDLYDFGFGGCVNVPSTFKPNKVRKLSEYVLHVTCRFKIIGRGNKQYTKRYYEDTSHEEFHADIQHLLGLKVKRVGLSDKNDLWLDLGEVWIVFATFEIGEESWRFFTCDKRDPHLVAADTWLELN